MKEKELLRWIDDADAVVIGAGSGLSTAAGLSYSGERFRNYFSDFIERYQMKDMYSAGFYPFATQEEKWAYWSRHIFCNRYDQPAGGAYLDLLALVKKKNYFVLTTNVDHQFWLAGFKADRIFATQGDYGKFQCRKACHNKLYDNEAQVRAMVREQKNCRIPAHLVPKCPVCGGEMEVNLRCDGYFVEDEAWHLAAGRYKRFLSANRKGKLLFLELGVGMNTPVIIKYPFWQMTYQNPNARYACINLDENRAPEEIEGRSVCIRGDIAAVLADMRKQDALRAENGNGGGRDAARRTKNVSDQGTAGGGNAVSAN
ncbi:Sir2 silent information regulator family NAD-dependent deacetylase [[Clostridium] symbiosum]|uniref:SIR2 family NAD-dependent protein deacylase n=1 Tax=Clostridium symbiosum TaxID=1512 RepID=UPI001D090AAC|nr:Sir2 silent information regulator family NAD-dependent deacetylase [[Clostridium] symbiosum]MCB6610835.1 Sir2 silent information regulator family NAD-dependent deacetylase [[Clostridium] symbiosum]MCB6929069.1 Sir2 silent information regulator family NAD-dependent deacetylase [[Clostridium] symbiosum]